MLALARLALGGRPQATALVAIALALGFLLPPLALLSGAGLGLRVLQHGLRSAVSIAVLALGLLTMVCGLSGLPALAPLVISLPYWLPVLGLAAVWRRYGSMRFMLQLAALGSLVMVTVLHFVLGDAQQWWPLFSEAYRQSLGQVGHSTAIANQLATIEPLAPLVPGLLTFAVLLFVLLSLLLARGWQSGLTQAGAFAAEFRALHLGQAMALLALLLMGIALWSGWPYWVNLGVPLSLVYLLQGLAVVHGVFWRLALHRLYLLLFYLVLFFLLAELVVIVGLLDTWLDLRRRVPARNRSSFPE